MDILAVNSVTATTFQLKYLYKEEENFSLLQLQTSQERNQNSMQVFTDNNINQPKKGTKMPPKHAGGLMLREYS